MASKELIHRLSRLLVAATEPLRSSELEAAVATICKQIRDEYGTDVLKKMVQKIDGAWKEECGYSRVRISTAHPLKDSDLQALKKRIRGAELEVIVSSELIGGANIECDDTLIEGSVAAQLDRMQKTLLRI